MGDELTLIFWIVLIVIFIVVEAMTFGLTTIWFALGAVVALVLSLLGASWPWQLIAFVVSSIALLFATRPLVVKHVRAKEVKTNVDSLIGKKGIVTKTIGSHNTGQIKVSSQIWTAVSADKTEIALDKEVEVLSVEGVKLIVKEL